MPSHGTFSHKSGTWAPLTLQRDNRAPAPHVPRRLWHRGQTQTGRCAPSPRAAPAARPAATRGGGAAMRRTGRPSARCPWPAPPPQLGGALCARPPGLAGANQREARADGPAPESNTQPDVRAPCEWQRNAPGSDLSGERRCLRRSGTRGVVSEDRWAGPHLEWRPAEPFRVQGAGEWRRKEPICRRGCCGGWARPVGELRVLAAGGCALLGGSAQGGPAPRRLRRGGSGGERRMPRPGRAVREGDPFAPSRPSC